MDLGLNKKSVLILASSKGLGKGIAKEFAKEGARIMITSRNKQKLIETAEEIKSETNAIVNTFVCDIKDYNQIKRLIHKTVSLYGTIDILINNSGGPPGGNFDELDDQNWIDAFELTLLSYIRSIREVLPYMKKQRKGHIINIASTSIKQPIDGLVLSNTYRVAINGLTKSLSQEISEDNIFINTVAPGRFATDRVVEIDHQRAKRMNISYEQFIKSAENSIPLKRYGKPIEFAKFIVFLTSDANTYITGQSLLIDGGLTKAL